MNFGATLAVYASVLKKLNMPLIFPGNEKHFHALREVTDARQLAVFSRWLSDHEHTHGHAFNVNTGDWYRFAQMWPKIAAYYGMEWQLASHFPFDLEKFMSQPKMKDAWKELVQEHGLRTAEMEKIATWSFLQQTIQREWDDMTLVNKAIEFGYMPIQDTEKLFYDTFDQLALAKYAPVATGTRLHTLPAALFLLRENSIDTSKEASGEKEKKEKKEEEKEGAGKKKEEEEKSVQLQKVDQATAVKPLIEGKEYRGPSRKEVRRAVGISE